MKNFILYLFLITTVVFAVLFGIQLQKTATVTTELAAQKQACLSAELQAASNKAYASALEISAKETGQERGELQNQVASLKLEIVDLQTAMADKEDQLVAITEKTADDETDSGASKMAQGLAEMMDSPEMRETIRMQIRNAVIDPVYGSLMKEMNLSEDEKSKFIDILMERYMAGMDMFQMMQEGADEEKWKDYQSELEKRQQEVNDDMKKLLGDEKYEKYDYYQNTEQERMQVMQLNQRLAYADQTLSHDQEEQLVKLMYDERSAIAEEPDYFDPQKAGPNDLTEEKINKLLQLQADLNKRVRDKSSTILDEAQRTSFEAFQDAYLQQQSMGLRMASQMFKKKSE